MGENSPPQIATPTINSPSFLFLFYFRASLLGNRHLCSACLSCLNYLYSFENGQVYSKDEEEKVACSKLVSEPAVGSEAHPASSMPTNCLCGLSPARKGTSSRAGPPRGPSALHAPLRIFNYCNFLSKIIFGFKVTEDCSPWGLLRRSKFASQR